MAAPRHQVCRQRFTTRHGQILSIAFIHSSHFPEFYLKGTSIAFGHWCLIGARSSVRRRFFPYDDPTAPLRRGFFLPHFAAG
jgi:hypothetical protein